MPTVGNLKPSEEDVTMPRTQPASDEEDEEDDDPFFAESGDADALAFLDELDTQIRTSDTEALARAHRHFWIAGGILITIVVCYTMLLMFK